MNQHIFNKVEFHSFHWDNFNPDILSAHKKVMAHFGIDVKYTQKNIQHGTWLDDVLRNAKKEVIAIIEPDLIPLNRAIVENAARFALENNSFLGCAQASNHIHPAVHLFVSPAFFFISKNCYEQLGAPSFLPTANADVAEHLCYVAEQKQLLYRTLFPSYFQHQPSFDYNRMKA